MSKWNKRKQTAVERLARQIEAHDRARAEQHADFDAFGLTDAERQFCVLAETRGKLTFRSGWPDFMVVDKDTGGLVFVEVKTGGDEVNARQATMFMALELVGQRVSIWRPEEPLVLAPWRRFCSRKNLAEAERATRTLVQSKTRPENENSSG